MRPLDVKEIRHMVNELIERGYKDSKDLELVDAQKLVGLLIANEFSDECTFEVPGFLNKLLIALRTNEKIDKEILAEHFLDAAVKANEFRIGRIFYELISDIELANRIENGTGISMDSNTGEIFWGK